MATLAGFDPAPSVQNGFAVKAQDMERMIVGVYRERPAGFHSRCLGACRSNEARYGCKTCLGRGSFMVFFNASKRSRCRLDLAREHARVMPNGLLPVLKMKNMRYFLLALALGFGLLPQCAKGQTTAQVMTFSIICQYVTNTATNINVSTQRTNVEQQVVTVLLSSANLVKAMAIDLLGTNWTKWQGAYLVYEQNLQTTNQGIYLRLNGLQTNVSSFFGDSFTNVFSQDVNNVFSATNYTTLPLNGGFDYDVRGVKSTYYTASGNLAYLSFSSTNTSFNIFGYSRGSLAEIVERYNRQLYTNTVNEAENIGAGTFSLNVTTNIYPYLNITNYTIPTNYTGLAHGTVYLSGPYYYDIGPPEGP
jgi:hypothetical protein